MANKPLSQTFNVADNLPVMTDQAIRENLVTKLEALPNFQNIKEVLYGSGAMDFMLDTLTNAYSVNNYYNFRAVSESSLHTATIPNNIYNKAHDLGYRINRAGCPRVDVKYLDVPTLQLSHGTVIGALGDQDLVYWGKSRKVEKGDVVEFVLGKVKSATVTYSSNFPSTVSINLTPTDLKSIDNDLVMLTDSTLNAKKSLFPEDFIVLKRWIDFSLSKTESAVWIANPSKKLGLTSDLNTANISSVGVTYLETDGFQDIQADDIKINNTDVWYPVSVTSLGYEADADSKIVSDAPLLYSVMRRATSEQDLVYILNNHPLLHDVSLTAYEGKEGEWEVTIPSTLTNVVGKTFTLVINNQTYSYRPVYPGETNTSVMKALYNQLKTNDSMLVSYDEFYPVIPPNDGGNCNVTTMDKKGRIKLVNRSARITPGISQVNLQVTNTVPQVPPRCCIQQVNYVHSNTDQSTVYLSNSEYNTISAHVDYYRPVGLTLFFKAAVRTPINLQYKISLTDGENSTQIINQFKEFVNLRYHRRTGVIIDSDDIATEFTLHINNLHNRLVVKRLVALTNISTTLAPTQYSFINLSVSL